MGWIASDILILPGPRPAAMRLPPGWTLTPDGKKATVSFRAKDFLAAIRLFHRIAEAAESLEHHPDLHLESYDRVRIETYSHDVGGLTSRDEALADAIHRILLSEGAVSGQP